MKNSSINYHPTDLLCGIDGGGTATKVVVCDLNGELIRTHVFGTINHYGSGIATARETFRMIAEELIDSFGFLPGTIFVGNSALSNKVDQEVIEDLTGGAFIGANVYFHSDVYIALLGFSMGKAGAVLISGTGSMACGIDQNGDYHTAGGWGQILGDEGSGYHMAQQGMKAALRAHDGMSEPTQLTSRLISYFNLSEVSELIKMIYYPPVEKSVIAGFATEVEQAAREGDKVAMEIIDQEAEWLYKLALAICEKCQTKNLGFFGSVLNNNDSILAQLKSALEKNGITLSKPVFSPEIGALIAAFSEAGIPINESILNNLSKYKISN